MRYFIKAYPMHEKEVDTCEEAAREGGIEDAEVSDGLIRGIADEATIKRLADSGIVVQAVYEVPEGADAAGDTGGAMPDAAGDDDFVDFGGGAPGVRGMARAGPGGGSRAEAFGMGAAAGAPGYVLADLPGGVSDGAVAALAGVGAEIVERDPSGLYVVRTTAGTGALSRLPLVADVRPYGVEETVEGAAALLDDDVEAFGLGDRPAGTRSLRRATLGGRRGRPAAGLFEAILHQPQDKAGVSRQLYDLGARIVSESTRSVRFVAKGADLNQIAELPGVATVAKTRAPRRFHDLARPLVGLAGSAAPAAAFPFDGSGEIVGVADTGLDSAHPDFAGRIAGVAALGRPGDTSDPDGHGTHVAGSVLGSGASSNHKLAGMAPGARLFFQSVLDANGGLGGLPDPLTPLFQQAYDEGVRVHNNSWGAYVQARYESMALDVDEFVWEHPDFLPVIAAGNEGSCRPQANSAPGFVDFPSLGSPATAKNGLSVGASRNSRTQGGLSGLTYQVAWPDDFPDPPIGAHKVSGDDQGLAAFSSRGPCDDMRIKPDVVAPGTDIASTRSQQAPLAHFWGAYPNNPRYAFMGGTSMASPIVAGCAALVRQYYRQERDHDAPSAALLKATLINGTKPLTGVDATAPVDGFPNYHQGFGRVHMASTLPDPAQPAFDLFFVDTWNRDTAKRFVQRQGRRRWRIHFGAAGELRICLAWTDPPARGLQNGLRIILDDGSSNKWIGNDQAATPIKVPLHDPRETLPGFDRVVFRDPQNNVQVIRAQVPAGTYTLALFADSLLKVPQDFALVVTGPNGMNVQEI